MKTIYAFETAKSAITSNSSILLQKSVEIRTFFKSSGLLDMAEKNRGLTRAAAKKLCWNAVTFQQYMNWVTTNNQAEFKQVMTSCGITGATQNKQIQMFEAMVQAYGPNSDDHDQQFHANEEIEDERIRHEVDQEMAEEEN